MAQQKLSKNDDLLTDGMRGEELVRHSGLGYHDYLVNLIESSNAKSYLEIGTFSGDSLARVNCAAIAIDPKFHVSQNVIGQKPACMMFQMASDDFFANHDPTMMFGRKIDIAFLDGLHLYEFLLRDFINTEKHCFPDSFIVMHDCVPPTYEMTNRTYMPALLNADYKNYWTGDVWKIIPILQKFRPDLKVAMIDCPPTGLLIVGNLNPNSTILSDNYSTIVSEFEDKGRDFHLLKSFLQSHRLISSRQITDADALSHLFESAA
jgi:hypothetical protein